MMQTIDVVMLTKNSEHLLEKCLESIYQNVPVNRLIVVDGFSTDKTNEILNEAKNRYGNVTILMVNGSRARARQRGIAEAKTDWFLFADSDVVLSKHWYIKAQESMRDDVGAVWGVNIDTISDMKDKRVVKLQTLVATECFNLRGGTHDTLVRRDLVADIRIPEELHTYEDAYIINWIKAKGYKAVVGKDIYCLHYKPPTNWSPSNAVSGAILELKYGLIYSKNFRNIIYYPFFTCYWFLQIGLQGVKQLSPA
jgi:glycosyltransferase involved in cell wall biosynthesis